MNLHAQRCSVAALTLVAGLAQAQTVKGPSSSATPYLNPVSGGPAVTVYSILTVGDSVNLKPDGLTPYRMVGLPDGLGAFLDNQGRLSLLSSHEVTTAAGVVREHGGTGAFVSQWSIDRNQYSPGTTTLNPNFLQVLSGRDLASSVVTTSAGTGTLTALNRFCSGDLPLPSAFFNPASGNGSQELIYLTGEEGGGGGRLMAFVVSERTGYQLPGWENLNGGWENALANPAPSDQTLIIGTSDGGDNRVFVYLGTKQSTGSAIEKAGLVGGAFSGITVLDAAGAPLAAETRVSALAASGASVYSARFSLTPGRTGTSFLRPEDGAWDPNSPRDFYMVTTDRLDTTDGGTGPANQDGRSRLWRLRFDDLANPTAGGTIEALITGTGGPLKPNMMDNICVTSGRDGHTRIIMQEDVGGASHNGKIWMHDVSTGTTTAILRHDSARFGDVGLAPSSPFTIDEESSGVIDASHIFGMGWFLLDVQAHYSIPGELVEGGQYLAFFLPDLARLCSIDFNADGVVDINDYNAFVASFQGEPSPAWMNADFDGDGTVDFFDYDAFVVSLERGCPSSAN